MNGPYTKYDLKEMVKNYGLEHTLSRINLDLVEDTELRIIFRHIIQLKERAEMLIEVGSENIKLSQESH